MPGKPWIYHIKIRNLKSKVGIKLRISEVLSLMTTRPRQSFVWHGMNILYIVWLVYVSFRIINIFTTSSQFFIIGEYLRFSLFSFANNVTQCDDRTSCFSNVFYANSRFNLCFWLQQKTIQFIRYYTRTRMYFAYFIYIQLKTQFNFLNIANM